MEKVKVVKLLDKKSGVSQKSGKPWQSREVYLESVQNVMHPEKYLARLFGDAIDKFNAKEGDVIGVVIHHFVNEKDGRYFNELSIVDFESNIR